MSVPILTYHPINILGTDYQNNDHVAFSVDLESFDSLGFKLVPLGSLFQWLLFGKSLPRKAVAVTFDDGAIFDWEDIEHPTCGHQVSMANMVFRHCSKHTVSPKNYPVTSFVIASPEAREELDRVCFGERHWWHDDWWLPATESGFMDIQNHSWDHNHDSLTERRSPAKRGTFKSIDNMELADHQIRQATQYIDSVLGLGNTRFFAFPYGESNDFLLHDYLPNEAQSHRIQMALTTDPDYLRRDTNRYAVPRFVCGRDWNTPDGLVKILEESGQ